MIVYTENKYAAALRMFLLITIGTLFIVGCTSTDSKKTNTKTNTKTDMENKNGTTVTLGGNPIHTIGKLPEVGTEIQDFTLTGVDLGERPLVD